MLLMLNILKAKAMPKKFLNLFYIVSLSLLFSLGFSLNLNASVLEKTLQVKQKFEAQDLFQALTAEIYNTLGEDHLAVEQYYQLSRSHNDPAIAKRVTELATITGQIAKALDGAKRWVVLNPNSLEANQYLALLALRNSHFKSAAKQLDKIRELIEITSDDSSQSTIELSVEDVNYGKYNTFQSNESLTFIGAMLAAESHHNKAFEVFSLYVEKYAPRIRNYSIYRQQQRLISAQLAMKAKRYSDAVQFIDGLKGLDAKNDIDATVMHAKALHKLHFNKAAIKLLKKIQNHPEANDSHRLELVRLLVLDKQKNAALPILGTLVAKHEKNYELLKSFIALQIDQSMLSGVAININKLRSNHKYINEANYFSGEFAEKLGQREKALINYEKVKKGSYLKNAYKKRINLTKKLYGQAGLKQFFLSQQNKADSLSQQAYWIKLQADDLLESKQYQQALTLYDKAVMLSPKRTRYRYKRGLANERLGNFEKAESDFNFVLEKRKDDVETLNALGYMLTVHTQRLNEAKKYIDKAYKLKPNDPLILDSLGFIYYKIGDLGTAEKYLRKAFQLMKKPEVASHLITVLAKSNQIKEAKSIYHEMQKKFPNSPSLKSVYHAIP